MKKEKKEMRHNIKMKNLFKKKGFKNLKYCLIERTHSFNNENLMDWLVGEWIMLFDFGDANFDEKFTHAVFRFLDGITRINIENANELYKNEALEGDVDNDDYPSINQYVLRKIKKIIEEYWPFYFYINNKKIKILPVFSSDNNRRKFFAGTNGYVNKKFFDSTFKKLFIEMLKIFYPDFDIEKRNDYQLFLEFKHNFIEYSWSLGKDCLNFLPLEPEMEAINLNYMHDRKKIEKRKI